MNGKTVIDAVIRAGALDHAVQEGDVTIFVWSVNAEEQIEGALYDMGVRSFDDCPGDVVAAYVDGTVILDDGISVWNPLRALKFISEGNTLQST